MYEYTENSVTDKAWNEKGDVCYGYLTIDEPVATVPEFVDCGFKPSQIEIYNAARVGARWDGSMDTLPVLTREYMAIAAAGDRSVVVNQPFIETLKTGTVSAIDAGAGVGLDALVGVGTAFTTEYEVGDFIQQNGETREISVITDDTNLTVTAAFTASAGVVHYKATEATGEEIATSIVNAAGTAYNGIFPVDRGFILGSALTLNADNAVLRFIARK
jgi:hypothetical protein